MNFGRFQLPIRHTLDRKTTQNVVVGEHGMQTFKVVFVFVVVV